MCMIFGHATLECNTRRSKPLGSCWEGRFNSIPITLARTMLHLFFFSGESHPVTYTANDTSFPSILLIVRKTSTTPFPLTQNSSMKRQSYCREPRSPQRPWRLYHSPSRVTGSCHSVYPPRLSMIYNLLHSPSTAIFPCSAPVVVYNHDSLPFPSVAGPAGSGIIDEAASSPGVSSAFPGCVSCKSSSIVESSPWRRADVAVIIVIIFAWRTVASLFAVLSLTKMIFALRVASPRF